MPAQINLKNGSCYIVDAYREDIVKHWTELLAGRNMEATSIRTYDRLNAGIPLPKITIDLRDISSVEESRR